MSSTRADVLFTDSFTLFIVIIKVILVCKEVTAVEIIVKIMVDYIISYF